MKITIAKIVEIIEQAAPLSIATNYDNVGLIVGDAQAQIESALICVDITEQVMDEAERLGVGLIISHHPIIFHPLKSLVGANYVQRVVQRAIKSDIALYACHTNLDATEGGMSYKLAQILGVGSLEVLNPFSDDGSGVGFGVLGRLERRTSSEEYLRYVKHVLGLDVIRHSDICSLTIERVAICAGSGASLIGRATEVGAELYIAADFKYNDFMTADGRLIVADVGHFESEYCAIDLIYGIITKKISIFALHKSVDSRNPINYLV